MQPARCLSRWEMWLTCIPASLSRPPFFSFFFFFSFPSTCPLPSQIGRVVTAPRCSLDRLQRHHLLSPVAADVQNAVLPRSAALGSYFAGQEKKARKRLIDASHTFHPRSSRPQAANLPSWVLRPGPACQACSASHRQKMASRKSSAPGLAFWAGRCGPGSFVDTSSMFFENTDT